MNPPRRPARLVTAVAAVAAATCVWPALPTTASTASAAFGRPSSTMRADTIPPTLVDFGVSPAVLDTSNVPQRIAFTAHLKDDSSGLKAAGVGTVSHVQFRSPGGHFVLARFDAAHLVAGTPTDGEYRDLVTLPAGADPGRWTVWQFRLVDRAGNAAMITAAGLAGRGLPSSFANTPGSGRSLAVTTRGAGDGTVRSLPVGIACPGVCSTDFAAGSTVRLFAAPSATSRFTGWQGACSGIATTCSLAIDGHHWTQANFAPDTAPLGTAFTRYVASRSDRVGVAVYDAHTGTTWTLNPSGEFQTGSIVKVQIMGAVLRRAQLAGRGLTSFEQQNIVPMIEVSDNNAATNLWNSVGGASGVAAFDHLAGMTATTPNSSWGLTTTTAADNVRLVRDYAIPGSVLDDHWRAFGLNLMEHVVDWQRWGVSGGATPGTSVALKNGWLPLPDAAAWRINSIGWIDGNGRDYVIAVLTDHNPSMRYGIDTIESLARKAWNTFGS
ncbi:MAG TPA: serine hydrolase [Actinomycetota bacterium]|nr:serine hydrolase [Actinomycetota bacterium]